MKWLGIASAFRIKQSPRGRLILGKYVPEGRFSDQLGGRDFENLPHPCIGKNRISHRVYNPDSFLRYMQAVLHLKTPWMPTFDAICRACVTWLSRSFHRERRHTSNAEAPGF
jgi:hypothetical protein